MVALHLALLRDSRQHGIDAAFTRLRATRVQAEANTPAIPADFIARTAAAFKGSPPDKAAFFGYLAGLPKDDPGFAALIGVVQTALFMSDPIHADASALTGAYADVWQQILDAYKGER